MHRSPPSQNVLICRCRRVWRAAAACTEILSEQQGLLRVSPWRLRWCGERSSAGGRRRGGGPGVSSPHNSLRVARLGDWSIPELSGFVAETADGQLLGMLTYVPGQDWRQCEVLTLHAGEQWHGAGTVLIKAADGFPTAGFPPAYQSLPPTTIIIQKFLPAPPLLPRQGPYACLSSPPCHLQPATINAYGCVRRGIEAGGAGPSASMPYNHQASFRTIRASAHAGSVLKYRCRCRIAGPRVSLCARSVPLAVPSPSSGAWYGGSWLGGTGFARPRGRGRYPSLDPARRAHHQSHFRLDAVNQTKPTARGIGSWGSAGS